MNEPKMKDELTGPVRVYASESPLFKMAESNPLILEMIEEVWKSSKAYSYEELTAAAQHLKFPGT